MYQGYLKMACVVNFFQEFGRKGTDVAVENGLDLLYMLCGWILFCSPIYKVK